MKQTGILLTGTEHDAQGKFTVTSECEGFHIYKNDKYTDGHIVLTLEELKGLVSAIESNFQKPTEPIPLNETAQKLISQL